MCGRFTNTISRRQIAQTFPEVTARPDSERLDEGCERFNVCPTEAVLAIDDRRDARLLRWGLVPDFLEEPRTKRLMINARAEGVASNPAFKGLVAESRHRCLVVADGWYEWLKAEDPKSPRVPMHMTLPGAEPFAFAGLWTTWSRDGHEPVRSCTIVTVAASPQAATVHDRMPAVLASPEERALWLEPAASSPDAAALLRPFDGRLRIHPANPRVNKAGVEGPENLVAPGTSPADVSRRPAAGSPAEA